MWRPEMCGDQWCQQHHRETVDHRAARQRIYLGPQLAGVEPAQQANGDLEGKGEERPKESEAQQPSDARLSGPADQENAQQQHDETAQGQTDFASRVFTKTRDEKHSAHDAMQGFHRHNQKPEKKSTGHGVFAMLMVQDIADIEWRIHV